MWSLYNSFPFTYCPFPVSSSSSVALLDGIFDSVSFHLCFRCVVKCNSEKRVPAQPGGPHVLSGTLRSYLFVFFYVESRVCFFSVSRICVGFSRLALSETTYALPCVKSFGLHNDFFYIGRRENPFPFAGLLFSFYDSICNSISSINIFRSWLLVIVHYYYYYSKISHIAQNIAETCQKYFQSFIAILTF